MTRLDYSAVIATRNREAALRLSLPALLGQNRPPRQLIVIDASDDHSAICSLVEKLSASYPVELTIQKGERGLTRQRNAGLGLVKYPVVLFPDDDSICFPDTGERILEVYERDIGQVVAAVCAAESPTAPPGFMGGCAAGYAMRPTDRFKQRFGYWRSRLERAFFPDPAWVVGRKFCETFQSPAWFSELPAIPVEWMTGFRMSFRTEIIRRFGFDEIFQNYCLFEDIDASFAAWKVGGVVAALKAQIYHYRSPERRANGFRMGFDHLMNKAYVVAKHTERDHVVRRSFPIFATYKTLQYAIAAHSTFGRERLKGVLTAFSHFGQLLRANRSEAAATFRDAASCVKT